jgi:hypothetical protein
VPARRRRGGRGGGTGRDPARGGRPRAGGDDPAARERARETFHGALDRGDDPERAARAALAVSRECVDAWLLLADFAASPGEARDHVRKAVEAATKALGEAGLREGRGRLGDSVDGAAYLHALAASARSQVASGRVEQGIQTFLGLLSMDPRDPVPVRGDLLLLLLAEARDDEAEEVVARFPEEASADWMFGRALLRWRRADREDLEARATAALDRAIHAFPAAARALATDESPAGSAGTAVDPVLRRSFAATEGAVEWLAARLAAAPAEAASRGAAASPARDEGADRRFNARECVEEAWEASGSRREDLARRALDLWPDCAEAWRALASLARPGAERLACVREALAAAERAAAVHGAGTASGGAASAESEEGRAVLEARAALATALREAGDEPGASAEERRLLDDDLGDGLGLGTAIVGRLLAAGRDEEAAPWLERHEDDAAPGWTWARVLGLWRRGERVAAAMALGEAMLTAPLVGPLLLGAGGDFGRPELGSRDAWEQARTAADALRPAWRASPGALEWLRARRAPAAPRSRSAPGRETSP